MTTTTALQQQLPPGPKEPVWFQLLQWISDPIKVMETSQTTYGDLFTLNFFKNKPFVFISNPDTIKEILSQDQKQFLSGKGNEILVPFVGEHSILLTDETTHTRQRKLMFPPFHGEKINYYGEVIAKITEKVAQTWTKEKPFSIRPSIQEITLEVIMQTIFGISEGARHQQLKTRLMKSLELATGSVLRSSLLFFPLLQQDFPGSPWRNFVKRQQSINDLLQAELEERRNSEEEGGNDILSLLLSARDEEGNPMGDEELRNQLMTLLFAGHETTATALTWAFYWIHKLPEVREKLLAELESVSDTSNIKELNNLSYLDAVCKEVLRIYPVAIVTFPRITKDTLVIGNYEYPPDTVLAPCIYLLHHREEIYPNSKQFKPERFLEREFSPYEFMPFGGGSRRCIGDVFAQMEMKIVIATILKNYQLTLAEKKPVKPVRRGVTVAPAGGVKMISH
ncbi:cytochrome P450 [Euhalothece natronophila Z-M001]|uniref:Cytochrome P450 n=1 Tax=Euhalothece natronophila Z-M001 TaxID=522448 RepID=A0A5B8NNE3_9CHRO|nr:cytochrome P450 [Euhalothece natronophila]QDZ40568.1 cytochrome P450 [Euhalothece natronophila Z-M001]